MLLRIGSGRSAEAIAGLLLANLPRIESDLHAGVLAVITDQRLRLRHLPIG